MDDVFSIWLHGEKELLRFFEYVHSYHDTIKYTWRTVSHFWMCSSYKLENVNISTDLYQNPTDTRQYLDYASCHPSHAKRAILYRVLLGEIMKKGFFSLRFLKLK